MVLRVAFNACINVFVYCCDALTGLIFFFYSCSAFCRLEQERTMSLAKCENLGVSFCICNSRHVATNVRPQTAASIFFVMRETMKRCIDSVCVLYCIIMQTLARKHKLYSALPHKLQIVLFRFNIHAEANIASVTCRLCSKSKLRNQLLLKEAYEHSWTTSFLAKTGDLVERQKRKRR